MAAISVTATMVPVGERVVVLTRGMPGQPPGPDGLLGIGVSFVPASDGQRHVIISVAEKGSAFSSGKVFVGDVIISVDGHITAGLPVPDVVKKMKGPPGTQVTIVFEHVGQSAFPQPGQVGTMTQAQQQQNAPSLRHVGTISPAPQHISAPHFQPSPAQHASPVHHAEPPVPQPMHSPLPKTPGSPEHQQFPTITAATLASPARVDNEPYHPPAPVPDAPLEGYHTKAWPDGKSYQGYFQNGMRHGKGVIKYPDGAMYDGEWKDDLRDGYGKYIYADGTSFQGEWKRGCRHGKGICVYSDGNTYEGDWVDSVPHGQGKCSFAQGGVYAGSFEVGKMHGFGTLRSSDGSILFQGEWRDGETVQPPAQVNPVDPPNHQPAYMGSPAPPPQIAPVYTDPYASSYQNSPPQTAQNNSYITSAPGGGGLPATLAAVKLPPSVAAVHAAGYVVDRDVIGQAERGGAEAGGLAQRRRQNRQDPGGERGGAGREPAARGRDRAHGRRPSLLARTGEGVEPRTRRVVRANRGGAKHRWMGLRHPPAPLPQLGGRARVAPHVDHHVPQLIRQRPHLAPRDERPPEVGRGQLQGPIADSPRPERRIECEMGPPRDG